MQAEQLAQAVYKLLNSLLLVQRDLHCKDRTASVQI